MLNLNSSYFASAADVYRYSGGGNAEAGETYLKNQATVRDHFFANYDK